MRKAQGFSRNRSHNTQSSSLKPKKKRLGRDWIVFYNIMSRVLQTVSEQSLDLWRLENAPSYKDFFKKKIDGRLLIKAVNILIRIPSTNIIPCIPFNDLL